jgi:hypothetical protein
MLANQIAKEAFKSGVDLRGSFEVQFTGGNVAQVGLKSAPPERLTMMLPEVDNVSQK